MTDNMNRARLAVAMTYTRRQMIAGSAVALGSLAVPGARAGAWESTTRSAGSDAITAGKAIHQEEDYNASPQRIYDALLDAKQFTAFSDGRLAEIDRNVGGTFSLFAGHIIGRHLELVADRRIVQAWRGES